MKYFRHLPQVNYSNTLCTNIIVRARIRSIVKNRLKVIYPYTVKAGERADIISHRYYGSSNMVWLIYYANDIYDPIFDWVLENQAFDSFIVKKYGSIAAAKGQIYNYYTEDGLIVDEETWLTIPEVNRRILYNYEYESIKNEKKREIQLVDNAYTQQLSEELKQIFR